MAFECLNRIILEGYHLPDHFIASGSRAPHLNATKDPISHLSNSDFIRELGKMNGTPEAVLNNRELMELLLPPLKADFDIAENHRYDGRSIEIPCPLTILGGKKGTILVEELNEWRRFFTQRIDLSICEGDHFFIYTHSDFVKSKVLDIVRTSSSNNH